MVSPAEILEKKPDYPWIKICFLSVPKSFCYVDGRRFRRGRVFITKDCKLKCRCKKNGKTRCTRLCKKKQNKQECGPDETLENINESSAGGRCSCETKICISTLGKFVCLVLSAYECWIALLLKLIRQSLKHLRYVCCQMGRHALQIKDPSK